MYSSISDSPNLVWCTAPSRCSENAKEGVKDDFTSG